FGIADRAQRDHDDVRLDPGAVRELGARESAIAPVQRGDGDSAAQIDAMGALKLGGKGTEGSAEGADQRGWTAFGDRHLNAPLAAGGGDLGPGEAGADYQYASRSGVHPLGQASCVLTGAQSEYAVECCFFGVRPRPRPGAGCDQQPVEEQ